MAETGTVYRRARLVERDCRLRSLERGRRPELVQRGCVRASFGNDWCYRAGEAVTTDGPSGRGGRDYRGWPAPARADGAPPVLDLGFDPDTLHTARARMRACAIHAGFPGGQAEDMVLAVHELAANAVRHGGGAGRLRVWDLTGALHCQVDDGDSLASDRLETDLNSLPCEHGHGLWVVQQVADHMQSQSGRGGTSVLVRFDRGAIRHFA